MASPLPPGPPHWSRYIPSVALVVLSITNMVSFYERAMLDMEDENDGDWSRSHDDAQDDASANALDASVQGGNLLRRWWIEGQLLVNCLGLVTFAYLRYVTKGAEMSRSRTCLATIFSSVTT